MISPVVASSFFTFVFIRVHSWLLLPKIFLEPRRSDQVKATSMCDVCAPEQATNYCPESKIHEGTTLKKQISPGIQAHFLRSAPILLSLVTFNPDIFSQTPTPTTTPTPTPAASCARPTPGVCVSYEAESDDNTLTGSAFILSCPTCSGGLKVGYVGKQCWYSPVQCCRCCRNGQLHRDDLLPQRRRGALRPSERERQSRNACELSVHWLVSDSSGQYR